MLTYIPLEHLKRTVFFPWPVANAGNVHFHHTHPERYLYSQLEVCLRLSSDMAEATDVLDGTEYHTPFPHVIYKMAGHQHAFHAADRREAFFFIYSGETAEKLREAGLIPENPLQPIALTGELDRLITQLGTLLMSAESYGAADRIDRTCFAILEELMLQRRNPEQDAEKKIRDIASLIQASPEKDMDLMRIARNSGFSERSFFRHWEKIFKVSPARYRNEIRMKQAAYLLSHTAFPIERIAAELHFCDDNYFSTRFRKYSGMTPREYRLKFRPAE